MTRHRFAGPLRSQIQESHGCKFQFGTRIAPQLPEERYGMSFVVKVVDERSGSSSWIAPHYTIGMRRLGPRDEARVFPTEADADSEIEIFRELAGDKFRFEIEPK